MLKKEKSTRFTVSMTEGLLAEIDRLAKKKTYASRSEFVRDLVRDRMVEDKWRDARQEVVGVLTIGYDHHQRQLTNKILDIQHSAFVNILCATHVHLDHDNCLEAIIIRGRAANIEGICARIGALRGVKFAKLSRVSRLNL